MGFKVIEDEEDIRVLFPAGLLWWKSVCHDMYEKEEVDDTADTYVSVWRTRKAWEAYVLVEE